MDANGRLHGFPAQIPAPRTRFAQEKADNRASIDKYRQEKGVGYAGFDRWFEPLMHST